MAFKEDNYWKDIGPFLLGILVMTVLAALHELLFGVVGLAVILVLCWWGRDRQRVSDLEVAQYIDRLTSSIERASFYALNELPIAIAVFDSKGEMRWQNNLLREWFPSTDSLSDVEHIMPGLTLDKIQAEKGEISYTHNDKIYNILHRNINLDDKSDEKIILVYVTDVTLFEQMHQKFDDSRLAIGYLQFDNYNNVLKGLPDSQRENVKAEVNKLVGVWAEEINGVCKQYTDDLYFVVLHRKALEEEIEKKFDFLDRVRDLKVGNKLPITFSIGLSCDGDDVVDIGEKAQSCLDMALRRGGDQAAVSFDGNIQFFGGMTMAQEKNTRVGARSAAQVIKELMFNAENIFISGHINEDFDSIGAAVGVAKMAMLAGKPVRIITSGEGTAIVKFRELAEDYEEYKNMLITDEEALLKVKQGSLLMLVDHHRPMLCAAPKLLAKVQSKIIIDHHRRAEDFIEDAVFVYQEPAASSTCELVTELITYFDDDVEFNRMEASILYAGIIVDSKNFAVQTGARTLEAAATLRLAGADPSMVKQLFTEDIDLVKSKAKLIETMEILPNEIGIAMSDLPENGNSSVAVAQVADSMLNMEGIKTSFVMARIGPETTVSARSNGKVNVQLIMEELGGGGHQTVAGVKIKNGNMNELKQQIIELVSKQMEVSDVNESNIAAR